MFTTNSIVAREQCIVVMAFVVTQQSSHWTNQCEWVVSTYWDGDNGSTYHDPVGHCWLLCHAKREMEARVMDPLVVVRRKRPRIHFNIDCGKEDDLVM